MKAKHIFKFFGALCLAGLSQSTLAKPELNWQEYEIQGPNGETTAAQLAYIKVPEVHGSDSDKTLDIGFVRIPSTAENPGNPIVYLAGGPGGSGTATVRRARYPLFVKMAEVADVIIYDQRGTGLSRNGLEQCEYSPSLALEQPLEHASYLSESKKAAAFCAKQWAQQGLNLNAYNTLENARDLEDLRVALKAEKLDLWAISYGTHLAMTAAKYLPQSIGRMVLASAEGPDETVKLPAHSDAQLERVAIQIAIDKSASERYPDLIQLMRDVHKQYRDKPVTTQVKIPNTEQVIEIGIGELDIQLIVAGALTRDPWDIATLPGFYQALKEEDFSRIGLYFLGMRSNMWSFNPMSMAMDAASGVSKKRWKLIQKQASNAILWRAQNAPFPDINEDLGVVDLGKKFRSNFKSEIPTLFFSGTLDGRTFTEAHRKLAKGFTKASFVTVDGGGHNLFMLSPQVESTMLKFYRGEEIKNFDIKLDPIQFH